MDSLRSGEPRVETVVTADPEGLADAAASLVLRSILAAIASRGRARIVLSGGSTPRATHRALARALREDRAAVQRIDWFFGDERWVGVLDSESNEAMARETLLRGIGASEAAIHSWHAGSGDPRARAGQYAASVREGLPPGGPAFDVTILGMGADGHTASLFTGALASLPDGRDLPVSAALPGDAAAVTRPQAAGWRLTLCPELLSNSRTVVFIVTGADKAAALARARAGAADTPAAWIRGEKTYFIVTRDAMSD